MKTKFEKVIGSFTGTTMVIGIVVGTGIFLTAEDTARNIQNPLWYLLAWIIGGGLATTGAITMAQLSSLFPQTGGIYIYIREAFGKMVAFFYGCISFLVLQCGSIAAVSVGLASYFGKVFPYCESSKAIITWGQWSFTIGQLVAIFVILLLTVINYIGAKISNIVQCALTLITLVSITLFLVIGFSAERTISISFSFDNPPTLSSFGLALVAILWAFSGWHNLNFASEEVKNSKKTITISLLTTMFVVTILYLLINITYITTLPMTVVAQKKQIAYSVMNKWWPQGAPIISLAIVVAALGTINGLIFASPRAYFAMARDGLFPILKPSLHQKYATPHKFIVIQGLWSSSLVLAGQGSYTSLFTYVMFSGFLFMSLAGVAILILRHKGNGEISLPWAYPIAPIIFILYCLTLAANTCYYKPQESIIGIMLILFCIPLYLIQKKNTKPCE